MGWGHGTYELVNVLMCEFHGWSESEVWNFRNGNSLLRKSPWTQEASLTQLHIYFQEATCFQRQKSKWVLLWAGPSSHKEGNAERQYGSGKILQAPGSGEWNAVFPQLAMQGT